ncbi:MAG TPA: hypothetical protein VK464_25040 [Symbiobacteriaceae bacterium]|nr:hypothetical protein [Symbiobacteriaceae bacterium]
MPRSLERLLAVLCYLGALRVPVVALAMPEWAYTVPSGLLIAGAVWAYGRRYSPFLLFHGREGFKWALQTNLLLAGLALLSQGLYYLWFYSGWVATNGLWHFGAAIFRWAGVLVSIITMFVMLKAARGRTGDALTY